MVMNELAYLLTGIAIGVVIVRYGIGLGCKIVYQVKEDEPFWGENAEPIEQDQTGDDLPIKQDQTEDL